MQKQANNQILLSICIPTYNRAEYLKMAVESVIEQIDKTIIDKVEIVVSDNASTDDTKGIIKKIKNGTKAVINYFNNGENVGFDKNCLLGVERARGKYVWLLGSDDLAVSGSLKKIVRELMKPVQADLYFCEKEDFYLTPDRPMRFRWIMRYPKEAVFNFRKKQMIDKYFRANKKLIAYLNYLSNIIFRRDKWLQVKVKEEFVGTGYIHVYVFQSMLWGNKPGVMKYLPVPLVKRRWGNDGLPELEGDDLLPKPEARLKQDVLTYRRIAAAVFSDKKYVRLIDAIVIRNDGFSWAVQSKINDCWRFYFGVLPFLWHYYWDFPLFWLKIVPLLFVPNFMLKIMRNSYRKYVKGEAIGKG